MVWLYVFFFFKQKTAYEMRISDWSSDVCSSDLQSTNLLSRGVRILAMYTGGVSKYMMDRRQLDDTFGESCRHAGLATTYWPEFDHTLMSPADRDRVLSSVGDWCEKFKVPAATSRLQAK